MYTVGIILGPPRLFATMRAGTRINADDVATLYGLVLTYRGEKCIQFYTMTQK